MRNLFELDKKDYQENFDTFNRHAVRAIIYEKPFLYMIRSQKYGEYKFPGGGIEKDETKLQALKREVLEESGIHLKEEMIPYGYTIEKRKSFLEPDTIFNMTSYYYICHIESMSGTQKLDPYEEAYGYHLVKIHIDEAIKQNDLLVQDPKDGYPWVRREYEVLKLIKDEL